MKKNLHLPTVAYVNPAKILQRSLNAFPEQQISLAIKKKVRELLREGLELVDILKIEDVDIKMNTWLRHFTRRYARDPKEKIDHDESGVTLTQWTLIQESWRLGYTDAEACWQSGISKSAFNHFMDLKPEREILRLSCLNAIEYRARKVLYRALDPNNVKLTKGLGELALKTLSRLSPETYASKDTATGYGTGTIVNADNVQINYGEPVKKDDLLEKAEFLLEYGRPNEGAIVVPSTDKK